VDVCTFPGTKSAALVFVPRGDAIVGPCASAGSPIPRRASNRADDAIDLPADMHVLRDAFAVEPDVEIVFRRAEVDEAQPQVAELVSASVHR